LDDQVKVHDPNQLSMPPSSAKTIEPAARAAALDARIQVRPLRRGDLEQVRDLHAFHGDTDRVSNQLASLTFSSTCPYASPVETTTQGSPHTALPSQFSHANLAHRRLYHCCGQAVWPSSASSCRCSPTLPARRPLFGGFATPII
jgi:hypothetical protein